MVNTVDVNMLAVFLGTVAAMAIGFVWYMPSVFGNMWMKGTCLNGKKTPPKQSDFAKMLVLQFLGWFIGAYVLAHFLAYADVATATEGMQGAFWAWLGFMLPVNLGAPIWEKHAWSASCISAGYNLASLLAIGAIIGGMM
jgi:hypothetical protein